MSGLSLEFVIQGNSRIIYRLKFFIVELLYLLQKLSIFYNRKMLHCYNQ